MQKIYTVEYQDIGKFDRIVNKFLNEGWKISSTGIALYEDLITYVAILYKEV